MDKKVENSPLLPVTGVEFQDSSNASFLSRHKKTVYVVCGVALVACLSIAVIVPLSSRNRSNQYFYDQDNLQSAPLQSQGSANSPQSTSDEDDRAQVLAVSFESSQQLHQLTTAYHVDVWRGFRDPKLECYIMVASYNRKGVLNTLTQMKVKWRVHEDDVKSLIDREVDLVKIQRIKFNDFKREAVYDYNNFNEFEKFEPELQRLANECPDGFQCDVKSLGKTYEGRDLNVLHIAKAGIENRKGYWMDSLIHAREWISGTTVMNIARTLIEEYGTNNEATKMMDGYDWYILPVMNPDGYVYTWTSDRLWRQNRSPNKGSSCIGTDLNRNFEYKWGGVGASTDPCNNEYRGAGPASELETQHIQRYMMEIGKDLIGWLNFHANAHKWLTTWAYTESEDSTVCALPEDYEELDRVAKAAAAALDATHGQDFKGGNWCELMYASSGVLQDHAKAVAGIKYTYTPELRGEGFIIEPTEIAPSTEEVWNGIMAMVEAIEQAP